MSRVRQPKVPGKTEWSGYESDLDVRHAHRLMFGKNTDEVQHLFGDINSISRMDELLFMPRGAFQYYVLAFAQFVMSPQAAGDSATASSFFELLSAREKRDFGSVSQIYPLLKPAVDYVSSRQEHFDADPNIYGNFMDLARNLDALFAQGRGAA
jgi:hypothetical protein